MVYLRTYIHTYTHTLEQLNTDAERLMVLDALDNPTAEAASAYVDDLKMRFSSPWSLSLGTCSLDLAARHYGVVYECGQDGKSTASFEGLPPDTSTHSLLHNALQDGTPHMATPTDDLAFLGVPDGLPLCRADGAQQITAKSANTAVRSRTLRRISINAAIAMRVDSRCTSSAFPLAITSSSFLLGPS